MMYEDLLRAHGLQRLATVLLRFHAPAVGFVIAPASSPIPVGASKLGGNPDLPRAAKWPLNRGRPLDCLLQVNLSNTAPFDRDCLLPGSGLLSFFYDLANQPWGFDPNDLDGFRVLFSPPDAGLVSRGIPDEEYRLRESTLVFHQIVTFPRGGSVDIMPFVEQAKLSQDEMNRYEDFAEEFDRRTYPKGAGLHHLLGHSANVQGDMQTGKRAETSLVVAGLQRADHADASLDRSRDWSSRPSRPRA